MRLPLRSLFSASVLILCSSLSGFQILSGLQIQSVYAQDGVKAKSSAPESIGADDGDTEYADSDTDADGNDPFESVNRKIFWFNDKIDINVLEPVAHVYEDNVPRPIQTGIGNFFENLKYPKYLVSDIVQLKFTQALEHTGRFLVNTTVGIAGLMDVAEDMGLEKHREDFGTALGYHGVGEGPYIVLPLVGPSNVRDTVGFVVDTFLDPFNFLDPRFGWPYSGVRSGVSDPVTIGGVTVRTIDDRAGLIEAVDSARESAVDYYLFIESAYHQHREGLIHDGYVPDDVFDQRREESNTNTPSK